MRQTQNPLPHGHWREHMVHQVRGALRHAAPATARTKAAPFARERHEVIEPACRTPEPGDAGGQTATAEKVAELLLDESGQPFSVTQIRGLRAERLEVIADHLVQHALRGTARLIGR